MPHGNITYAWREPFTNREIHALHAAAFKEGTELSMVPMGLGRANPKAQPRLGRGTRRRTLRRVRRRALGRPGPRLHRRRHGRRRLSAPRHRCRRRSRRTTEPRPPVASSCTSASTKTSAASTSMLADSGPPSADSSNWLSSVAGRVPVEGGPTGNPWTQSISGRMLGVYPPHNIRSIVRSTLQRARRTAGPAAASHNTVTYLSGGAHAELGSDLLLGFWDGVRRGQRFAWRWQVDHRSSACRPTPSAVFRQGRFP